MRLKLSLTAILISLAIQPLSAQVSNLPSLTGSWQLTLTSRGPSATAAVTQVPGLATFTSDGSVIETDGTEVAPTVITASTASPVVGGTYGTPGHGIWQPGPAIGTLYVQFINLIVNQNATLHSRRVVTITGSLDSTGNSFTGTYSSQLLDSAGRVMSTGSGAVTMQKIPHPLLP